VLKLKKGGGPVKDNYKFHVQWRTKLMCYRNASRFTGFTILFSYFRLKSYVRKTRTIQIDSAKVTYIAADKEVKVYADTSSNGVKRNMKNVRLKPVSL
jgi:hypothetical protein